MVTKTIRKVVKIDEDKCDGCGLCIPACAEGAIQIIAGKAKLVDDRFCDGLGACLGECPRGAITVEVREAADFDEAAVRRHLAELGAGSSRYDEDTAGVAAPRAEVLFRDPEETAGGCPGAATLSLRAGQPGRTAPPGRLVSELGQWPVKIELVNPRAPYFRDANLMVIADCSALAYANVHPDLVKGRAVAIGCPKFGDLGFYTKKISAIVANNNILSVAVTRMEVPCCGGLTYAVRNAVEGSGNNVPVEEIVVGIQGDIISRRPL